MAKHHEVRVLPYSAAQIYDLVTDVARYPEFLPWVSAIRVRSDSETEMLADMIVGFKALKERFTSRVTKERAKRVHVDYIDGPLKYLFNDWQFTDTENGGCAIDFTVEFGFKNKIFEVIAGQMFDLALRKMIGAFEARAHQLYASSGINSSSAISAA